MIYNLHLSPIHPTAPSGAVDPLLFVTPCYLLYISDEGVFEEKGGRGVEEGSSFICRAEKYSTMVIVNMFHIAQSNEVITC